MQLYRSGNGVLTRLGGVSLDLVSIPHGASQDSRDYVGRLTTAHGGVDVQCRAVAPNSCEACASYDFTAHLAYDGHSVVGSEVTRYDELGPARRPFAALAVGDKATVASLADPPIAAQMISDAGAGRLRWTGKCYGESLFDQTWPADAVARSVAGHPAAAMGTATGTASSATRLGPAHTAWLGSRTPDSPSGRRSTTPRRPAD